MNVPCRGCGERDAECHARCARYREFQEVCAKRREERLLQGEYIHYSKTSTTKTLKRYGKNRWK